MAADFSEKNSDRNTRWGGMTSQILNERPYCLDILWCQPVYSSDPFGMVHLLSLPAQCGVRRAQLARTFWWLKASVPYHKGRLEHTALFLIMGFYFRIDPLKINGTTMASSKKIPLICTGPQKPQ